MSFVSLHFAIWMCSARFVHACVQWWLAMQPFCSLREACIRMGSPGCTRETSASCKPCQSAAWLIYYAFGLRPCWMAASAVFCFIRQAFRRYSGESAKTLCVTGAALTHQAFFSASDQDGLMGPAAEDAAVGAGGAQTGRPARSWPLARQAR